MMKIQLYQMANKDLLKKKFLSYLDTEMAQVV